MKQGKDIRLLLVEDEQKLNLLIKNKLKQSGYEVIVSYDGLDAEKLAHQLDLQLIILDLSLPGKSGLDVLMDLRKSKIMTPVLILSARESTRDRILGLELGADDYVVKPFDSGELIARIESILRRTGNPKKSVLKAADLILDLGERTVERAGKKISLTDKEYSLLEFFLRNKNQILTRKRLMEQVWGYQFETGTNIVDVYVSYLRESVDKGFSCKLIRTIHGEGFILMDPSESMVWSEPDQNAIT